MGNRSKPGQRLPFCALEPFEGVCQVLVHYILQPAPETIPQRISRMYEANRMLVDGHIRLDAYIGILQEVCDNALLQRRTFGTHTKPFYSV